MHNTKTPRIIAGNRANEYSFPVKEDHPIYLFLLDTLRMQSRVPGNRGGREYVVDNFIKGDHAQSHRLFTDGEMLVSYHTPIAFHYNKRMYFTTSCYSRTTSKHQSGLFDAPCQKTPMRWDIKNGKVVVCTPDFYRLKRCYGAEACVIWDSTVLHFAELGIINFHDAMNIINTK